MRDIEVTDGVAGSAWVKARHGRIIVDVTDGRAELTIEQADQLIASVKAAQLEAAEQVPHLAIGLPERHDGFAPHSHEVRADHRGVLREAANLFGLGWHE
jgi:hypothetical protein